MKSSGSTWLYNAVIYLLQATFGDRSPSSPSRSAPQLAAFYADGLESFPKEASGTSHLVVKTHIPSEGMQLFGRLVKAQTILTIRDPRDAIASLMRRFDHSFDNSLREVSASSECLVQLATSPGVKILRYEDGFYATSETLTKLAALLALETSSSEAQRICRKLLPRSVGRTIATLRRNGVFGRRPTADSFDPWTHWHPGHVGDRKIGKYKQVLSEDQQDAVLTATKKYCKVFGYAPLPSRHTRVP